MSIETVMDHARLAAFVDGELSPEEAAEVVMHLADHPVDQTYVDNLMAANEALAQAFDAPMHEPVPAPIEHTIMGKPEGAQIIPFRRKTAVWMGTALAASVALAMVVAPMMRVPEPSVALAIGPVDGGSALGVALDQLPSGTPQQLDPNREVMILATLPVENGYCREVEIIDHAVERIDMGIACSEGAQWTVAVTLAEPLAATGTQDGFVAASGTEVQSLQPFLDRLGAGVALTPADEAAAMARDWGR